MNFDSLGNKEMQGKTGKRGNEEYKQPPKGYLRIGLKVLGLYDNGNNNWIGKDETGWHVAYHGTKNYDFVIP